MSGKKFVIIFSLVTLAVAFVMGYWMKVTYDTRIILPIEVKK